ncbi:hypothetical protein E2C01_035242 [Portunus trituberculatus]|uniref:Uncharacterized protein n=1 Tax=Portunus trituberculatus TaxID=210409 RepID=A0A5B7F2P0_PORTR|nr:hypothetical protein [Portunus trituberculatus]
MDSHKIHFTHNLKTLSLACYITNRTTLPPFTWAGTALFKPLSLPLRGLELRFQVTRQGIRTRSLLVHLL